MHKIGCLPVKGPCQYKHELMVVNVFIYFFIVKKRMLSFLYWYKRVSY